MYTTYTHIRRVGQNCVCMHRVYDREVGDLRRVGQKRVKLARMVVYLCGVGQTRVCMHRVYDRIFGDYPAKKSHIYAPCIRSYIWQFL